MDIDGTLEQMARLRADIVESNAAYDFLKVSRLTRQLDRLEMELLHAEAKAIHEADMEHWRGLDTETDFETDENQG